MAKATKVVKKEKVVTPDVSKEPVVIETKPEPIVEENKEEPNRFGDIKPFSELGVSTDVLAKGVVISDGKIATPEEIIEMYSETGVLLVDSSKKEPVAEVPMEEAILTFVESRNTPEVRLNEFLKSLYGLPQAGAKQKHEHITELRYLRSILASLDGKLTFTSRQFLTLGNTKYEGVEMKAKKITLNDINIVVKK